MSSREHNKRVAVEYFDAFVKGDKACEAKTDQHPALVLKDCMNGQVEIGHAGQQNIVMMLEARRADDGIGKPGIVAPESRRDIRPRRTPLWVPRRISTIR
jgi:hypothetical protein